MIKKITATIRNLFSRIVRYRLLKSGVTNEISPSILRGETAGRNSDCSNLAQQPASDDQVVNPRAKPSDGHSGKVDSGGSDDKTKSDSCLTSDGQDKSPEIQVHLADQPAPNGRSSESAGLADTCMHPQVHTEIEPSTSNSVKSQEEPIDPRDDASQKASSPSSQSTKAHELIQDDHVDVGLNSSEDLLSPEPHDETKPKKPRQIQGRRAHPTRPRRAPEKSSNAKPQFMPRPELICRKAPGTWQWEVVLAAGDECNVAEVRHNGGEPWHLLNGECRLSSYAGSLSIAHEDGKFRELNLFNGTPMVFKLSGNWKGDGRKVERISNGHFIVVVPKEWRRTGLTLIEPEECTDRGFLAHYFFRDRGNLVRDGDGFEEYGAVLTRSGITLTGNRVFDDSEDGELFVGDVPRLSSFSGAVWARVGEERKDGWQGENFKPAERSLADVLNGRQGRFFIRVYNDDIKLLDSGEFRYLRDLREIRVNGELYSTKTLLTPTSMGHASAELKFVGADDTAIRPILTSDGTHTNVKPDGLIVSPHPENNDISCTLTSNTGRVDIEIKLPRIWWRVERDDGEVDERHDIPLAMTRQEFRKYAETGAKIRIQLPPRITSIKAGFDEELDRVYRPSRKGAEIKIPLDNFVDHSQIDQRPYESASFKVQCEDVVLTLIRINADPVPTIISFMSEPIEVAKGEASTLYWVTRNTESDGVAIMPGIGSVKSSGCMVVAPAETTTYTLTLKSSGRSDVAKDLVLTVFSFPPAGERLVAHVKRTGGGWKLGKGFSRAETRAAGLADTDAARRSISIDRRRRSEHQDNIETIRRLIDA